MAMSMTDAWYVYRARAGDRGAFDKLFERHSSRVFNLMRRLGASVPESEDLAQETFVTAYSVLSAWRGRGAFSTWLLGIAFNMYRNHSRGRRTQADEEPLDDELPSTPESDPFARCTEAESIRTLQAAIADLPVTCREAFVLVYVEEFSYVDAAHLLGVPLGTVQSRLNRAKRNLHARLTADLPPSLGVAEGADLHVV